MSGAGEASGSRNGEADRELPAVGTATTEGGISRADRRAKFSAPERRFLAATFHGRRELLAKQVTEGVAVLFGAKSVLDAWEEHRFDPVFRVEAFRQESNFFYLTGLEIPGAAVTLDLETGDVQVFLPRIDDDTRAELDRLELGRALPLDAFEDRVAEQVRGRPAYLVVRSRSMPPLRSGFAEESTFPRLLAGGWPGTFPDERLSERVRRRFKPSSVHSLVPALLELRRAKDEEELGAIRDAAAATVDGFLAGMAIVAPGLDGREVAADMERGFRRGGAQRTAFSPVIQSGDDIVRSFVDVVDSYDRLNRTMAAGELALLDYGAELDYYMADLARTVPVSGRFSEDQRIAYDTYMTAYRAGLDAIGPGTSFMAAAEATAQAFRDQLPDLPDWLRPAASDFADACGALRPGHFLGLDLHDHEEYYTVLQPGEVVAYEHHFRIPQRRWRITVEDMVLVTTGGREILSERLPRDAEDIEALMAAGSEA